MLNIIAIEDVFAQKVKDICNCQVHLKNIDYTEVPLEHPRIVIDIKPPKFFPRPSEASYNYATDDPKKSRKVIYKQFELSINIMGIDTPDSNTIYELLQKLLGELGADYCILFKGTALADTQLQAISDIKDLSLELGSKIETRYLVSLIISGDTIVYDKVMDKILSVDIK